MEVDQRAKMRDLLKREAQLHFDTYVEISNTISTFCEEYGIQLVLRFNSDEMNPKGSANDYAASERWGRLSFERSEHH